jgi:chemotaxis protein methyltransferase CheR
LRQFDTSREELRAIAGHLTIPETYFFRIPDHFRAFEEVVLPDRMQAQRATRQLNILSAGCASGEEPYSVAMILRGRPELAGWKIAIRGIDVNSRVIAAGKAGHYSAWSLREIAPAFKDRYLRGHGRSFLLHDSIRKMVSLREGNLADATAPFWQPAAYDAIFFRNVLIYFSPEAGRAVVASMARSLAPGGYLFLGAAETLRGVSQDFHLCHTHGMFYYRRKGNSVGTDTLSSDSAGFGKAATLASASTEPAAEPAPPGTADDWANIIYHATQRVQTLTGASQRAREIRPAKTAPTKKRIAADVGAALDLLQKERFGDALDALRGLPSQSHADADVQLLRAILLTNAGKLAEAEKACTGLLHVDELNAGAHYVMALCREHSSDRQAAREHDQTAAYLDPSFAMPHLHLGLMAKRDGEPDSARQELNQALLLLPHEDSSRILLFGGGFSRDALTELCRRELRGCGEAR